MPPPLASALATAVTSATSKLNEITLSAATEPAPTWKFRVLAVPSSSLVPLKLVEPAIRSVFHYLGISDWASAAVEYDEFGDERLTESLAKAEAEVDAIVDRLLRERAARPVAEPLAA